MKCIFTFLRRLAVALSWLIGTTLVTLVLHQVVLPLLGFFIPALVPALYDLAVYGSFPSRSYVTFDISSPSSNIVVWSDECSDGLVLISPFGPSVQQPGPMIVDSSGELVWASSGFGIVMNLKVQEYNNEKFLTFWAGDKDGSRGVGKYYMLNESYDISYEIIAVSTQNASRMGDMHDFIITQESTALITIYETIQYDLSNLGRPRDGWIVDSIFQEIDLSTGVLVFEWRASDHLKPEDSMYVNPFGGYKQSTPYDFFHINSIDKDSKGNYLISSRHFSAIYCLSSSGSILWTLGGSANSFQDTSSGRATSFKWQHDARWIDEEEGLLSLFDNENAGMIMRGKSISQGLIVQIDTQAMTVTCVQEFRSNSRILSASQGSMQGLLERDHTFIGWGSSAAYSEFASDGTLLCEIHITPSVLFWWERVKTYRAIKTTGWIGKPSHPPSAVYSGANIHVSWNGATEIATWRLEGSLEPTSNPDWQTVDIHDKQGFEDSFSLGSAGVRFSIYRVAALDKQGKVLTYSNVVSAIVQSNKTVWPLLGICAVLGLTAGVVILSRSQLAWPKLSLPAWKTYEYTEVQTLEMY